MIKQKKSLILGLSVLLALTAGILPVTAQEMVESETINATIENDYNYLDKDIVLDGIEYNLFYDARDKYSVDGPSAFVKNILSTSNTVKVKASIKYGKFPFDFNVSHCYFNDTINKPKCKKSCKKLIVSNGVEYVGGIVKWNKLEKIVCGTSVKDIAEIKNCKNLKSIKILSSVDYISDIKNCKKLSEVIIKNAKKSPMIDKLSFQNTKKGIKFVVKNKKVAKQLKKQLKKSGVKNAKIFIGRKVVYQNVNG